MLINYLHYGKPRNYILKIFSFQQARISADLKRLRNFSFVVFFVINIIFVALILGLQKGSDATASQNFFPTTATINDSDILRNTSNKGMLEVCDKFNLFDIIHPNLPIS